MDLVTQNKFLYVISVKKSSDSSAEYEAVAISPISVGEWLFSSLCPKGPNISSRCTICACGGNFFWVSDLEKMVCRRCGVIGGNMGFFRSYGAPAGFIDERLLPSIPLHSK
jgi:hypothetical protein